MDLWRVFSSCSRTGSKETMCRSLDLWGVWDLCFFIGGKSAAEWNDWISMAGIYWRNQPGSDAFGHWNDQQRKHWYRRWSLFSGKRNDLKTSGKYAVTELWAFALRSL